MRLICVLYNYPILKQLHVSSWHQVPYSIQIATLIARFTGQHGAHLGPTRPSWAPLWPHELCYLVKDKHLQRLYTISCTHIISMYITDSGASFVGYCSSNLHYAQTLWHTMTDVLEVGRNINLLKITISLFSVFHFATVENYIMCRDIAQIYACIQICRESFVAKLWISIYCYLHTYRAHIHMVRVHTRMYI